MNTNKFIKNAFIVLILVFLLSVSSICVFATEETQYTISITSLDNVTVTVNDVEEFNSSFSVAKGAKVVVSTDSENLFCFADSNNKLLTKENSFTFYASGDLTIKPIFLNTNEDKVLIIYQNDIASDAILAMNTYLIDSFDSSFTEHTLEKTSIHGYSFVSWDKTVEEIKELALTEKNIIVKPIYLVNEESYKIEVSGGTILNKSNSNMYQVNSYVTLNALEPKEGMKFAYWIDGQGRVLSTAWTVKVVVTADDLYTAVYIDENDDFDNIPVVTVSGSYDPESGLFNLLSHRFIPSTCTINAYGLIYVRNQLLDASALTIEKVNGSTIKASATYSIKTKNGYWTNQISFTESLSIRAYVKYTDDEGQKIAYSDVLQLKPFEFDSGIEDFSSDSPKSTKVNVKGNTSKTNENSLLVSKGSINFGVYFGETSLVKTKFDITFNSGSIIDGRIIAQLKIPYIEQSSGEGIVVDWDSSSTSESTVVPLVKVDANGVVSVCGSNGEWVATDSVISESTKYTFEIEFTSTTMLLKINGISVKSVDFNETRYIDIAILDANQTSNVLIDNVSVHQKLNLTNQCNEHAFIENVVAPTVSSNGYTVQTCKHCGAQRIVNYVLKLEE